MYVIRDNFLSIEENFNVLQYCQSASYTYGATDNVDTPITGFVHYIPKEEPVFNLLFDKVNPLTSHSGFTFYTMYINCFSPAENPYFHIDNREGITLLYYPQFDWNLDDGGETQLFIGGTIHGIIPIANRLLMFDSGILHRATSFRDRHRFTIAIKYE